MGKLDDLKRSGQIGASFGSGAGTPAGMDLGRATGLPARLQGLAKDRDAAIIPVDRIVRDESQPREEFDEGPLGRLAESMRSKGQLQPIRVRWDEGRGAYVVIMGERRWRAAALAGLPTLRCVVQEGEQSAEGLLELQLVENALREDLKPIEKARAYRRLMETHGWSGQRVAREFEIDPSAVSRTLSLLEAPQSVQDKVDAGDLGERAAAEIATIGDHATQELVADAAVEQKLNRDEVTQLVRAVKAGRRPALARPTPATFDLGDGSVVVRWKKPGPSAVQLLKRALKAAQDREREAGAGGEAA